MQIETVDLSCSMLWTFCTGFTQTRLKNLTTSFTMMVCGSCYRKYIIIYFRILLTLQGKFVWEVLWLGLQQRRVHLLPQMLKLGMLILLLLDFFKPITFLLILLHTSVLLVDKLSCVIKCYNNEIFFGPSFGFLFLDFSWVGRFFSVFQNLWRKRKNVRNLIFVCRCYDFYCWIYNLIKQHDKKKQCLFNIQHSKDVFY